MPVSFLPACLLLVLRSPTPVPPPPPALCAHECSQPTFLQYSICLRQELMTSQCNTCFLTKAIIQYHLCDLETSYWLWPGKGHTQVLREVVITEPPDLCGRVWGSDIPSPLKCSVGRWLKCKVLLTHGHLCLLLLIMILCTL